MFSPFFLFNMFISFSFYDAANISWIIIKHFSKLLNSIYFVVIHIPHKMNFIIIMFCVIYFLTNISP